jgi:hypothetical protein
MVTLQVHVTEIDTFESFGYKTAHPKKGESHINRTKPSR